MMIARRRDRREAALPEGRTQLSVTIPISLDVKIRETAVKQMRTLSSMVTWAFSDWFAGGGAQRAEAEEHFRQALLILNLSADSPTCISEVRAAIERGLRSLESSGEAP